MKDLAESKKQKCRNAEMQKAESKKQKAEMARLQRSVFPISAFPIPQVSGLRSPVSGLPPLSP
jgi:hypothetical protein